jgi:hypothetical protein
MRTVLRSIFVAQLRFPRWWLFARQTWKTALLAAMFFGFQLVFQSEGESALSGLASMAAITSVAVGLFVAASDALTYNPKTGK